MSTNDAAAEQFKTLLTAMQSTPFEAVDTALSAQLKAVDDWAAAIRDNPALTATAAVARAQIQGQQRMLDVARRESETVVTAMRQAAKAMGIPAA